jgi:hypothetical protein
VKDWISQIKDQISSDGIGKQKSTPLLPEYAPPEVKQLWYR